MKIHRPQIILDGIQIKSAKKAKKLAKAVSVIEEECGIYECRITIKNAFICPWINLSELSDTGMEGLIKRIITLPGAK